MCGYVRFGAWVLVLLQAARCVRVRVGAWVLVSLLWRCLLVFFALWGLCWRHFLVKTTAGLQLPGEESQ